MSDVFSIASVSTEYEARKRGVIATLQQLPRHMELMLMQSLVLFGFILPGAFPSLIFSPLVLVQCS